MTIESDVNVGNVIDVTHLVFLIGDFYEYAVYKYYDDGEVKFSFPYTTKAAADYLVNNQKYIKRK